MYILVCFLSVCKNVCFEIWFLMLIFIFKRNIFFIDKVRILFLLREKMIMLDVFGFDFYSRWKIKYNGVIIVWNFVYIFDKFMRVIIFVVFVVCVFIFVFCCIVGGC